jgi:hypothetical protein
VAAAGVVLVLLVTSLPAVSAPPGAELPRIFIDTIYHHPSGSTLFVGDGGNLQAALNSAQPGDTIVLEAGAVYSGNFNLSAKDNPGHKWIYIISSALDKLPPPGKRVSPADAVSMPKIVTPNASNAFTIGSGAGYVRFVGIEMSSTSTYAADPNHRPHPVNGFAYFLIFGSGVSNITVDRSYLHGSDTEDINHAIGFSNNSSYIAVVDSDVRDIHGGTNDSQAFCAWASPGPFKLVNNFLSATGEDVMFGGAGGYSNAYVPADIEVRNNHIWKNPEWSAVTSGPKPFQWAIKNNFECKSCMRLVMTGNVLENAWYGSDQVGSNILLTPRTNQSGYTAVVDDITIEHNTLKNANNGFSIAGYDTNCRPPACEVVGETKRVVIRNNLILLRDPTDVGSYHALGFSMGHRMDGMLIQHNTVVGMNGSQPWASFYFNNAVAPDHPTDVWILDNVLSRQPTGDGGRQGQNALDTYIPLPGPNGERFKGNVMFVPAGDQAQSFPKSNVSTTAAFNYQDGAKSHAELLPGKQLRTSDSSPAGADISKIEAAMVPPAAPPVQVRPEVVTLRPAETTQFHAVTDRSSWHITPELGSITPAGFYTAPAKIKKPTGVTVCTRDNQAGDICSSVVLLPAP